MFMFRVLVYEDGEANIVLLNNSYDPDSLQFGWVEGIMNASFIEQHTPQDFIE